MHAVDRRSWSDTLRGSSLTLTMLGLFVIFTILQTVTGWYDYNDDLRAHGEGAVSLGIYLRTGHLWEALFENWESEFLQMAAFVTFSTFLYQQGSPESRRLHVVELVDADPRDHTTDPDAPWPVRRGGWVLALYERSLGLALVLLFLVAWVGHLVGGWAGYRDEQVRHGERAPSLLEFLTSSRFWFESFQNWQSEFLAVGAMVWLAVYLRQRGSPESKPVHAPHAETGR
jgi:hypothetical protein